MTQEAKAYDEAIRKLRGMMPNWERLSYNGKTFLQDLINIFPELRESENEKARKIIMLCLEECVHSDIIRDYEKDDAIAWLEKQGTSYTKMDVDDAFVEGMAFAKDELEKQCGQKHALDIEIPFGAKDSELQEATYLIPEGFHAEIESDKVVMKKGKQKPAWDERDESHLIHCVRLINNAEGCSISEQENAIDWLKSIKNRIKGE